MSQIAVQTEQKNRTTNDVPNL